jgi:hypothetical protein
MLLLIHPYRAMAHGTQLRKYTVPIELGAYDFRSPIVTHLTLPTAHTSATPVAAIAAQMMITLSQSPTLMTVSFRLVT